MKIQVVSARKTFSEWHKQQRAAREALRVQRAAVRAALRRLNP